MTTLSLVALFAASACGAAAPSQSETAAAPTPAATNPGTAEPTKDPTAEVAAFYQGKTIRLIVGSSPGGGFDTYARFIAQSLGKHIPGGPDVIVENMGGAGSLIAANHLANVAPKDGSVIGHTNGGLYLQNLLGVLEGFEHNPREDWYFLGIAARDRKICFVRSETGITSLEQVLNPDGQHLVLAATAPGSGTWDAPTRLNAALDLNVQIVDGYEGSGPERLAVEQGEVDGVCGVGWESFSATSLDRVESGEWRIIAQMGVEPIDHPVMQGVPMAQDLAQTDRGRDIINLGIAVPGELVRPFHVSSEVPAERAAALRQAFADTIQDPEFVAAAAEANLVLDFIPGERVNELITDLFQMPDDIQQELRAIMEQHG